jgi:hypothetical protein
MKGVRKWEPEQYRLRHLETKRKNLKTKLWKCPKMAQTWKEGLMSDVPFILMPRKKQTGTCWFAEAFCWKGQRGHPSIVPRSVQWSLTESRCDSEGSRVVRGKCRLISVWEWNI